MLSRSASVLAAALLATAPCARAAEVPAQASTQTSAKSPAKTPARPVAGAPARPDVDAVTTNYQAWNLRCESRKAPAPSVRTCGLMSTVALTDKDGKLAVATVVMLRPVPGSEALQLSMELPLDVWLPTGVVLLDAKGAEMARLPFVVCHPTACEAGQVLTPAQLSALSGAGGQASAVYHLQTQSAVKLSFSMSGFTDGLKALRQTTVKP